MPPINSNNNRCTYYAAQLEPKQNNDRVWYLKCYRLFAHAAENGRPYYHHFPSSASAIASTGTSLTLATTSTTLVATSSRSALLPISSPLAPSSSTLTPAEPRCTARRCTTTRAPSKRCSRVMCKRHCEDRGGCRFHVIKPPPQLLPPLSGPSLDAFQNLRAHADPFPAYDNAARMYELREQQRRAATLAIFPSFSPSPTDAQTNADYQIALRLALQNEEDQADPLPAPNTVTSTSSVSSSSERKGKKRTIPADDNDDDEIEVISYRQVIKIEPETPPRQVKRPRLTVQIPAAPSTSSLPSSSSSIPALSASYSTASCDSIPSPGSSADFPFYITSKDSDT
ncbi:hypothetical protein B0H17DRAFT_1215219 [Mycena rosella]|uniref:Uncharacterized protein n=1 Tax=Mycena rosella TaxID=1033263 RepID=A0AAD7G350_MYCRO|nr:hypothetical protein B0H17DRAFT_1215219 [Mycena rosella]